MNPVVPMLAAVAACAAVGVIGSMWLPSPATALAHGSDGDHVAATLGAMAWFVGLALHCAACATASTSRYRVPAFTVGAWLAVLCAVSTLLFAGTYGGLEYRSYWTSQLMLLVLLAWVWTGGGAPAARLAPREADVRRTVRRKAVLSGCLLELVFAVRRNEAFEAAVFLRAVESLAGEVRQLPSSAHGVETSLLLSDVTRWLDCVAADASPDTAGARLQQLAREADLLRRRFARWRLP